MSNTDKAVADKAKNYSAEQEAQIIAASPFDLAGAKALGEIMGKSYRSVIAKALSLQCDYITKPPPAKKVAAITKAELVSAISKNLDGIHLSGLEKATAKSLVDLLDAVTPTVEAVE